MRLKRLIEKTRTRLSWPLNHERRGDTLEIISDHIERTHTIYLPEVLGTASEVREIEYLHELGHALLCETAHPMFSTHYFAIGTPQEVAEAVIPAIRAASEWFVDGWLMEVAPKEEKAEIDEHLGLVMVKGIVHPTVSPEMLYAAALIMAQASRYLKTNIETVQEAQDLIDAFLSVSPKKPTIERMETLVNRLLTPLYPYRLNVVNDGEMEVWRVTIP